jgi:hypothetical protein
MYYEVSLSKREMCPREATAAWEDTIAWLSEMSQTMSLF